ncbi:indolethylamine N-methyltransferase-like [Hyperolius riggenbachi]|uniref:indolethylamine N-methyltransferase-like n=1 Tax=Hyperolius riggenbachi TaxID=752182 RepID=UPI0035A376ED
MDSNSDKLHYMHKHHDSRGLLETYYSGKRNMPFTEDVLKLPMQKMSIAFKSGDISGNILADISATATVHYLFSATKFFREIILMRANEQCMKEIKKWQDDDTGAFRWGHMAAHDTDIEGKSDQWEAKEMKLKSAIKVVKFDTETESQKDLIGVPQADCVITALLLDGVCENKDDYKRILKKILGQLKPGGPLIMLGAINCSYYTVGRQKFRMFTYDEKFVKEVLVEEGMNVLQCDVTPRKSESDLTDYEGVLFLIARKQK